jgi:hypothetical protein
MFIRKYGAKRDTRRIRTPNLEAYLRGERLKDYTVLLSRIRRIGLKAIIAGCEHDLILLKRLLKLQEQNAKSTTRNPSPKP